MQINKSDNSTDTHRQILTHNLYVHSSESSNTCLISRETLKGVSNLLKILIGILEEFCFYVCISNFIHYGAFQLLRSDDSRILKKFQLKTEFSKNFMYTYLWPIFKYQMIQVNFMLIVPFTQ